MAAVPALAFFVVVVRNRDAALFRFGGWFVAFGHQVFVPTDPMSIEHPLAVVPQHSRHDPSDSVQRRLEGILIHDLHGHGRLALPAVVDGDSSPIPNLPQPFVRATVDLLVAVSPVPVRHRFVATFQSAISHGLPFLV